MAFAMQADAAQMEAESNTPAPPKRGRKLKLLSLADIDRRTRAYQRTAELIASVESDLGGTEQLSTGERQIVQRAAVTGALIEDWEARWLQGFAIDPALYATLCNAQRRLFETVGLSRRSKDVTATLADKKQHYAAKATEAPAEPVETLPPSEWSLREFNKGEGEV